MNTANKLTITLSPEEVRDAIRSHVIQRFPKADPNKCLNVTINLSEYGAEFTGATVEVTQP